MKRDGPYKITQERAAKLKKDYPARYKNLLTPDQKKYLDLFIARGDMKSIAVNEGIDHRSLISILAIALKRLATGHREQPAINPTIRQLRRQSYHWRYR